MAEGGGIKCFQGNRYSDFGGVYPLATVHGNVVGGVAANIRGLLKGDGLKHRGEAI